LVKEIAVSALTAGARKSVALSATLSTGTTASGQFVLAVVDAANAVTEMNESNNTVVCGPVP
jgi:hypothetical protein